VLLYRFEAKKQLKGLCFGYPQEPGTIGFAKKSQSGTNRENYKIFQIKNMHDDDKDKDEDGYNAEPNFDPKNSASPLDDELLDDDVLPPVDEEISEHEAGEEEEDSLDELAEKELEEDDSDKFDDTYDI
jgi:hypothetical protein